MLHRVEWIIEKENRQESEISTAETTGSQVNDPPLISFVSFQAKARAREILLVALREGIKRNN